MGSEGSPPCLLVSVAVHLLGMWFFGQLLELSPFLCILGSWFLSFNYYFPFLSNFTFMMANHVPCRRLGNVYINQQKYCHHLYTRKCKLTLVMVKLSILETHWFFTYRLLMAKFFFSLFLQGKYIEKAPITESSF